MAQTGFTPIQIYSSSTAAAAPVAGSLTNSALGSELAINITDGKLFYKDNANAIQVIGWKVVPATAGGTGQTSYTQGDLLYATSSTTLGRLADVATGNALISGGVGADPAWGKIGLTTHVSGTLPFANGGTGTATAFTAGSVVFAGASGVYSQNNANFFWDNTNIRLGLNNSAPTATLEIGTAASTGRFIQVNGSSADTSYTVLYGKKQYPRIDLEDTAAGGSTFQIWNLGNQLRFGTNPGSASLSAFNVAAGNSANVTFNGNVVIGTSGNGIDFSATPGTGTSELFSDYEEGTWTATLKGSVSDPTTPVTATGRYTRVGRLVQLTCSFDNVNTTGASGNVTVTGLPFNNSTPNTRTVGVVGGLYNFTIANKYITCSMDENATAIGFSDEASGTSGTALQHSPGPTRYIRFAITYYAA